MLMIKTKAAAVFMVAIMSLLLFTSCSKRTVKATVVKGNDPWYSSSRFKLDRDIKPSEFVAGDCCAASNDKIFFIYSLYEISDKDDCRRTVLDTYDDSGELLDRKQLTPPRGYDIDSLKDIQIDPEGKTANAIAVVWGKQAFDTGRLEIDLETGKVSDFVKFTDASGKTLQRGDWGVSTACLVGEYCIATIVENTDTYFYLYKGAEYVGELDTSQMEKAFMFEPFSYNETTDTLNVIGHTYAGTDIVLEFDPSSGKLVRQSEYEISDNSKVNSADYRITDKGELCRIDSLGNITRLDTKADKAETVIDNNWYSPFFSDLTGDNKILTCSSDRTVIRSTCSTPGTSLTIDTFDYITVLTKNDGNPHAGKQIIELAMPLDTGVSVYLSHAIYEFNKNDSEYLIRVWNKYKTGFTVGSHFENYNLDDEKLYTMIQHLKGSEAPDLVIGIQKNYAMRDEIFMDLTGMLDESVMGKQYGNVIEACKIGGKQFFLPVTLEIEGLVTNTDLIADGAVGITFEDYGNMVKKDLKGFSPYDFPLRTYNNKVAFILSCIDTKAAIEGENIDFGTKQFYAAVRYAKDNFIYADYDSTPPEVREDIKNKVRGESMYARCKGYLDFVLACCKEDGNYTLIGTPSVNASGPRFRALETISVAANTDRTEGCKSFLGFLFDGAGYETGSEEIGDIITNKTIMESSVPIINIAHNKVLSAKISNNNAAVEVGFYNDKIGSVSMVKNFLACLSTISTYYYEDPQIVTFVIEETQPYYSGSVTLEQAVSYINDRVTKYVREK